MKNVNVQIRDGDEETDNLVQKKLDFLLRSQITKNTPLLLL